MPFLPPGDLQDPRIKLKFPVAPTLAGGFFFDCLFVCFTTEPPGKAFKRNTCKAHSYSWKDKWMEVKLASLLIVSVLLGMYYVINTVLVIRDNLQNKNTTNGVT